MLDKYFAQSFIDKIRGCMEHKFMIFNTEGVIIAATETERVGVFHEASYKMITRRLDKIIVQPEEVKKYLGVKHGVDMTIKYNNEVVGGIGITGIPEEVMPIITMAKITIEAMLDYEIYKEETDRKNNERDEFYSFLLRSDFIDTDRLYTMAKHMLLHASEPRFCILFELLESDTDTANVLHIIQESPGFTAQDIAFIYKKQEIVLFKTLPRLEDNLFKEYKNEIEKFLIPIYEKFVKFPIHTRYYIGSMQNKLENYRFSYKHCQWLRDYEKPRDYFYDQMNEYIQAQIPAIELHGIFNSFADFMTDAMRQDFVEIISALNSCNYSLVDSSKKLHIHKNTLIFHLNKIRELYNINPLQNGEERAFTDYLCRYLKSVL